MTPADWRKALLANRAPAAEFGGLESSAPGAGLRLITRKQPEALFGLQAALLNQITLKQGDTLFIRFAAPSLRPDASTGVTKLRVGFSKNSPN